MGFYKLIYNIFSYPFGWLIFLFYTIFQKNYLMAVIVLAILVKLVLLPTSINQQKSQAKTKRMQARINKIKSKYTDPQEQQQAIQDFYSKEGFGSMSTGCGALLIQMPVIMGLYGAIYMPLTYILRLNRYGDGLVDTLSAAVEKYVENSRSSRWMEIPILNHIDELKADLGDKFPDTAYNVLTDFAAHFRAGPFNFGDIPGQVWHDQKMIIIIPVLAFAAAMLTSIYSLIRSRRMNADMSNMATMGCMLMFMPFMSLWLSWSFPVGIGIYWAVNSVLSFIQMIVLDKLYTPEKVIAQVLVDETNDRRSKELVVKQSVR